MTAIALESTPKQRSPSSNQRSATKSGEHLTFQIDGEHYAIDILCVQEIRSFEAPTRIANAPPSVCGVIDLRGNVVPIVDLRKHLKAASAARDASTVVIVVAVQSCLVGLVVDAVSDVVNLAAAQMQPAPDFCSVVGSGLIQQMALLPHDDGMRLLVLLDLMALLTSPDLALIATEPSVALAN